MKNIDKLFIHLFTKGIEHYRSSDLVIREIDNILKKDENLLLTELQEAFNQANRLNLMDKYAIPYEYENIGKSIEQKDLPKDLAERMLKPSVSLSTLKNTMNKYLTDRR